MPYWLTYVVVFGVSMATAALSFLAGFVLGKSLERIKAIRKQGGDRQ